MAWNWNEPSPDIISPEAIAVAVITVLLVAALGGCTQTGERPNPAGGIGTMHGAVAPPRFDPFSHLSEQ